MSESATLARLLAREDLAGEEVEELFGRIVDGRVTDTQIAALLAALATKGETPAEIAGAVRALRARVRPVPPGGARSLAAALCGRRPGRLRRYRCRRAEQQFFRHHHPGLLGAHPV